MAYKGPVKDYTLMQAAQIAAGRYQLAPQTLADGDFADLLLDSKGNLKVTTVALDGTGAIDQMVQGDVASGAADSGNPVKVGGIVLGPAGAVPNLGDGVRGNVSLTSEGAVLIAGQNAGGDGATAAGIYRKGTNASASPLGAAGYLYNGASWDRVRGPLDNIVAVASGAYTTTQTQADQTNFSHRGITAILDMTVVGTGSVTLEIDIKDPVSGKYVALLTGAAVTTNSTNIYQVFPGATIAANLVANAILSRTWRIKVTANNANSATYSVGVMLHR